MSGGSHKPKLQEAISHLREGDVLVVWKLDRLSRSLKDLLFTMEKIVAANAGFRSLTEHLDTTTPAGRMLAQVLGSFAEFERSMVRERTCMGLAAARAKGRIGGGDISSTRINGRKRSTWLRAVRERKPRLPGYSA